DTRVVWRAVRQRGHIDDNRSRWPMPVLPVLHDGEAETSRTEHDGRPVRTGSAEPPALPSARIGYDHLARLFAERAALPDGDPRRKRLRAETIAGPLTARL